MPSFQKVALRTSDSLRLNLCKRVYLGASLGELNNTLKFSLGFVSHKVKFPLMLLLSERRGLDTFLPAPCAVLPLHWLSMLISLWRRAEQIAFLPWAIVLLFIWAKLTCCALDKPAGAMGTCGQKWKTNFIPGNSVRLNLSLWHLVWSLVIQKIVWLFFFLHTSVPLCCCVHLPGNPGTTQLFSGKPREAEYLHLFVCFCVKHPLCDAPFYNDQYIEVSMDVLNNWVELTISSLLLLTAWWC